MLWRARFLAVIGVIAAIGVACSGGSGHTDRSAQTSRVPEPTTAAASSTTTPAPTTATTVAPSTTITTVPESPAVPPGAQPPGCEGSADVGQYLWGVACDGSPLQPQQGNR
jgi:hypothetical protein